MNKYKIWHLDKINKAVFFCLLILICLLKINVCFADARPDEKDNNTEIPKINSVQTLLSLLRDGDLLLLDIDDTILRPGTIKYICPPALIESNLVETISELRAKGVIVLFLTARHPMFSGATENHLMNLGVPVFDWMDLQGIRNLHGIGLFKNGVLYAPNQEKRSMKGDVLKSFLEKCMFQNNTGDCKIKGIRRIFLVDDLEINIQSFLSAFREDPVYKNISFEGYVFESPKTITPPIESIQGFSHIFEMCRNLFILMASIFKYYFSSFFDSMGHYFG